MNEDFDAPINIELKEDSEMRKSELLVDGEKAVILGESSGAFYPKPLRKLINALFKDFLNK